MGSNAEWPNAILLPAVTSGLLIGGKVESICVLSSTDDFLSIEVKLLASVLFSVPLKLQ